MTLIEELIDLRETRGVSQAEVAASIGVKQSAVSHWERGHVLPSEPVRRLLEQVVDELRKRPAKAKAAA